MNKKKQNAKSQLPPLCELPSAWPLGRPHPLSQGRPWPRLSQAAPAPSSDWRHLTPLPTSPPRPLHSAGASLTHLRRGARRSFSRVFPPLPTPTPGWRVAQRPPPHTPPREEAAFPLVPRPLSYRVVHASAASAVWAAAGRPPPPRFCGLKNLALPRTGFFALFSFDFFGIFPRSLGGVAARAHARTCPHCTLGPGERTHAPPRHRGKLPTSLGSWGRGGGLGPARPEVGPAGGLRGERGSPAALRCLQVALCWSRGRALDRRRDPGRKIPGLQDSVQNAGEVEWKLDFFLIEPLSRG